MNGNNKQVKRDVKRKSNTKRKEWMGKIMKYDKSIDTLDLDGMSDEMLEKAYEQIDETEKSAKGEK